MAKKKSGVQSQNSIMVLKGSLAWRDWFRRLAKFSRMPGAVLVDRALVEWAERNKFDEKPPDR